MAKEEAEGKLKVEAKRDVAIKALEEEKGNRKASKEQIKKKPTNWLEPTPPKRSLTMG